MAPSNLRRSSSSASAPAGSYSQRTLPQRRPYTIPLNRDNFERIRLKLGKYRAEVETLQFVAGLDARDSSNIVAQALYGRGPKNGRTQSISGRSERSFVTDVTNDTNDTGFTITFNSKTGAEQQEKVKRQLDPILKARKDLLRSVGTCPECRMKKVKCSLSHHALEDLLVDHPEAAADVRWALEYDTDPKQAERNITSPLRDSPNGPAPLQSFAEEDTEDSGAQRQDVVGQVNDIFGVGNADLSLYSQELDVDGLNDGNGYPPDIGAAGNQVYSALQVQTEFCQPIPVQQNLYGGAMQTQPYASSSSYPRHPLQQSFIMPPGQSSNSNFTPRSTLSPSQSYQSSASAPQSHIYSANPQSSIYTPPEMQPVVQSGDFGMSPIGIDEVVVAAIQTSTSPRSRPHDFRCMVDACGLVFPMIEQMTAHLRNSHAEYDLVSPNPIRRYCFACGTLSYQQCTSCGNQACSNSQGMPGAQSPWLAICGKLSISSSFGLEDADMTGMWDMTNAQISGNFNFMGSSNDNGNYESFNGFNGHS